MSNKNARRQSPTVSAGSMADIAFLLLIFFLVTTTIDVDKGILARLPPWSDDIQEEIKIIDRNVLSVKINAKNELLVESTLSKVSELKELTKEFILNPMNDKNLAMSPKKAIISLQNDRGTSYEIYLQVYNELKAAYNELWNERAENKFGKSYSELEKAQQKEIRNAIPMIISEAESTGFGE